MANGSVERFLGGSPLGVLVRLLFISLLVGAAMAFLGLSPLGALRGGGPLPALAEQSRLRRAAKRSGSGWSAAR